MLISIARNWNLVPSYKRNSSISGTYKQSLTCNIYIRTILSISISRGSRGWPPQGEMIASSYMCGLVCVQARVLPNIALSLWRTRFGFRLVAHCLRYSVVYEFINIWIKYCRAYLDLLKHFYNVVTLRLNYVIKTENCTWVQSLKNFNILISMANSNICYIFSQELKDLKCKLHPNHVSGLGIADR